MTYSLQDLATGYTQHKEHHIVSEHVNATLVPAQLTCLMGPNGAGKSTLLRTLSAFQPPVGGHMMLGDRDVAAYTPRELARIIGVVLTERPNLRGMRVHEMVAMGRSPYTGFWGTLHADDHAAVQQAIEQVGIASLADRHMDTLSDGERQKVMIAKALAQQTPIILLDEPTAFLDFPSKVEMMLLLRRLSRERQLTVLLSTHDIEIALQVADRLWLMEPGRQGLIEGSTAALAADGTLARFFSTRDVGFDATALRFNIHTA